MDFSLPILLALLVGKYLKDHPGVVNKAIPYLIFASQFLGRLVLEVAPADAGVFSSLGHVASGLLPIVASAALTTISAVGLHSVGKNTWQGVKKALLEKAAKALSKDV